MMYGALQKCSYPLHIWSRYNQTRSDLKLNGEVEGQGNMSFHFLYKLVSVARNYMQYAINFIGLI